MKRLIVLLIVTVISYQSISQISVDSTKRVTCIPNTQLNAAVRLIEKGKLDAQKVELQERIIANRDSMLRVAETRFRNFRDTEAGCLQEVANLTRQNVARESIIADLTKKYKGQRRKTVFVGIVGALAVAATAIVTTK